MADSLQVDLVSPERRLLSTEARQVQIPGMEGELTAMPNHAPFLTTLRPGIVRVVSGSDTSEYVVTGGFAEISPTAATILAEQAVLRGEESAEMFEELAKDADAARSDAPDDERRAADQRVRDVARLRSELGK